ncbi:MAG: class I SAM-dependent methyltransferase [PVC group bacterium]|nr:class I SAM-dependent methyltransferase [PVC group bacterium]
MKKSELKFLKHSMMYVPNYGTVVEIGSWMGRSSEQLVRGIDKYCPEADLRCIDPFDAEYFKKTPGLQKKTKKNGVTDIYGCFKKRMRPYSYSHMRMTSVEAAKKIVDDVHFVFIDGNHDYEYVKQDIELWGDKLEENCVMCGHDYHKPGVKKAVDELCENVRFPAESMWMVVK